MVTGGAGFIGSNLLLQMAPKYPQYQFINVDCLTYAGNLSNLHAIEQAPNYRFAKVDIQDADAIRKCADEYEIDGIIHLAAESHVDRSILGPDRFIQTNVMGTFHLLEIARAISAQRPFRFLHVSTDEVFGTLGNSGKFTEESPYRPNSPYSASKASADHLVRAYYHTYKLDIVTTNCSNNYGPYQFPEKLIPLIIRNAKAGMQLPVYGDGKHIRDWLYVEDHGQGLDTVFHNGKAGETYALGGNNEIENIELVRLLCRILDELVGGEKHERLITFVADRPGHDRRYAIDAGKINRELGWEPKHSFQNGIRKTVQWYLEHDSWLQGCITGEYRQYYEKQYAGR
jgi:dTDP-glucose 4,6-dehydratase